MLSSLSVIGGSSNAGFFSMVQISSVTVALLRAVKIGICLLGNETSAKTIHVFVPIACTHNVMTYWYDYNQCSCTVM